MRESLKTCDGLAYWLILNREDLFLPMTWDLPYPDQRIWIIIELFEFGIIRPGILNKFKLP